MDLPGAVVVSSELRALRLAVVGVGRRAPGVSAVAAAAALPGIRGVAAPWKPWKAGEAVEEMWIYGILRQFMGILMGFNEV